MVSQTTDFIPQTESSHDAYEQIHEAARVFMSEHGFSYDGGFPETGNGLQEKFNSEEERRDKRSWLKTSYLEKNDGTPGMCITFGRFDGNSAHERKSKTFWADNETWQWLSEEERVNLKKQRELSQKKSAEKAEEDQAIADELADKASNRFLSAIQEPPKEAETYFSKKNLPNPYDLQTLRWEKYTDYSHEKKREEWVAIVALRDAKGSIRALQELWPEKKLWKNEETPRDKHYTGKNGGCFASFGLLENGKELLVCEGIATAITLFQATNSTCIAAMSSGNLAKVIKSLKIRYPKSQITICADNDHQHSDKNPGYDAAIKVANEFGCKIALPKFPEGEWFSRDEKPRTDFDDLRQILGENWKETIKKQIQKASNPISNSNAHPTGTYEHELTKSFCVNPDMTHNENEEDEEEKSEACYRIAFLKGTRCTVRVKEGLKRIGCQYSTTWNSWVFPEDLRGKVVEYLTYIKREIGQHYELIEVLDTIAANEKEKRKHNIEIRLSILNDSVTNASKKLEADLKTYRQREENTEIDTDYFRTKPKPEGKTQEQLEIELDIHHRLLKIEEQKEEIGKLEELLSEIESQSNETIEALNALSKNEIGDANLFVQEAKAKYVFDPTEGNKGSWFLCDEIGYWSLDRHKARYNDFQLVCERYLKAAKDIDSQDPPTAEKMRGRAYSLQTSKRRANVLETASSMLSFKGAWDRCIGILACKNGVVDLKTGEFRKVCPQDYLKKHCPTEYNPNASCPLFEQFLLDVMLGDHELAKFVQRVLGYAIFGDGKEEIIVILYGPEGRNGKGTLMKTLENVLGSLAHTFPSEMLLMQRNPPSSSSPSPDLAHLEGCRLAIFSEINKGRQIDASKVKNLSGRDTISTRRLFSNIDLQIKPSHVMFIQTNHMPKAPADDEALWARNVVIPFNARFIYDPKKDNERKVKPDLKESLLKEKEGILAWLVKGCLQYQKEGLNVPDIVKEQNESYRAENDVVSMFIEDYCIQDSTFSSPAGKFRDAVREYAKTSGLNVPTERDVKQRMQSLGFEQYQAQGCYLWKGISIAPKTND